MSRVEFRIARLSNQAVAGRGSVVDELPLPAGNGHSAEGSRRYVVVNAKMLLDSADTLQEVIDFFRETRDVRGSDFKRAELKANVSELGLNVCEPLRASQRRSVSKSSFMAICARMRLSVSMISVVS